MVSDGGGGVGNGNAGQAPVGNDLTPGSPTIAFCVSRPLYILHGLCSPLSERPNVR